MRNIEKGVLLAEMFNADTSKYVPSFIAWIKSSSEYNYFIEKKKSLNIKRTWKARRLRSYFDTIDIDNISSIKEGIIQYGKICYLVKITSEPAYTNPLIIEFLDDEFMKIGDLQVEFDGKLITLRELSLLEGFDFERKEEIINSKLENWIKEVDEAIFTTVDNFKNYSFYLPKIKLFSIPRIIELVYLLLINALFICIYFVDVPLFREIVVDQTSLKFFVYSLAAGFIIAYDIIYIVIMIYRFKKYYKYIKCRKGVFEKIYIEKEKSERKLRLYLFEQLATYGSMDKKVHEFSTISKYYPAIGYISNHIAFKRRVRIDKITSAEITGFIVTFICLIALAIVMFI